MSDEGAGEAPVVLAVDLGTGGPKIALVDLDGTVIGSAHRRIEPRVSADGAAVQDADTWWEALLEGAGELVEAHPAARSRIVAVAVTGQWGSTVPVDAAGDPVGDCILWMDTRARDLAREALGGRVTVEGFGPRKVVEFIRRAGGAPSLEGNDPLGQRLWIEYEQPDVYRRTAHFLEPLDFLVARLTGRVCATPVSMLLSWLFDNRRLDQARYDPVLVALAGADPSRLPPLLPVPSEVGPVRLEVARRIGLPDGVPVVTALPDLHTAALGSGAVGLYEPHMAISTSAWIGCHTPGKRTSIGRQMATVPSALPDRYLLANNHETAGVCAEWARNTFVLADDGLTEPAEPSLAAFDAVAAKAPSGSGGVLFAPWLNGERSPVADTALRGSFHNLSLSTTRAEMVRSVLEGVAHNARWLLEASEKVLRHPLDGMRVVGGGAVSDVWCQIHADVLGRPLARPHDPLLVSSRGAAFFAGLVLGHLRVDDLPARAAVERTFEPDPSTRTLHDAVHREFTGLHKAEKAMYHRLRKLR